MAIVICQQSLKDYLEVLTSDYLILHKKWDEHLSEEFYVTVVTNTQNCRINLLYYRRNLHYAVRCTVKMY